MAWGYILLSETEPTALDVETAISTGIEGETLWVKPSTGEERKWNGSSWDALTHSHATHGAINFTGTVSADGDQGLTGQKTIAGYTFTFKKGLLVGFQAP